MPPRSKSASSSRGNSSARTGSSSRASSKGSKRAGKAALKLQNKADRLHDNATEFIEKGDSKSGLKELAKLIRLHAKHQKQAASKKKPATLCPAWQVAEEYALTANSEMVFRAAAMDAQQDVQWLSREALRFVGGGKEDKEDGESSKSGSAGSSRSSSAGSKKGGKKSAPNYLAGQNALKKALKAMILNNQAVQRWVSEEPLPGVITLLQRALTVSEGVFCSLILYNLAVAFMACGRFEDTTETVARCLEITNGYMQHIKPPSMRQLLDEEEAANRPKAAPKKKGGRKPSPGGGKGKGESAGRAASATPAASRTPAGKKGSKRGRKAAPSVPPPSEEELAEMARQSRLTELRRRWKIYSTFVVTMATHTILCHHAIATLAVWCGMEGLEQYHSELALGCAKKYLPIHHPLQKRCRDRLQNITTNALPRIKPHCGIPPQLPLIAQADFIATPCATATALPPEESPFPSGAGASKMPPVRLSELLSLATTVAKPGELVEFMRAMAAELKGAKKDSKGKKSRSRSASLPVLKPGSRGKGAAKRRRTTGDNKALMLERLMPPHHEDPPVAINGPQFVTKVPRIAYERYERLKDSTIYYLSTSGVIKPETPHTSWPSPVSSPSLGARPKVETPVKIDPLKVERRRESMVLSPPTITRANGQQVPPQELMVQYDSDLRRMSQLVKDRMPEVRFRAAQMMQRQWRFYAAHLELQRRKTALEEWFRRADAASNVWFFYRRWKERLPAIMEARELRRRRTRARQLTKVQAFLYQMQSVEEWGRRCAAYYQHLLEEKRERERRNAAATMIQSVWRMHAQKLCRIREHEAATKIQTQFRCRQARVVLMGKRVHQKLLYERFLRSVEDRIILIQRWYRACKARLAVAGLLERRKKEIEDYLNREEEWFDREMGHLMDDPTLETKVRKIMSVLRASKLRRELHRQWKSRHIMNRALTKFALRRRGVQQLHQLREEKHQREIIARRREEVADAATQIQAMVRQRQAKQHVQDLKECFAMMDDAARCIQRAFAQYRRRVAIAHAAERKQLLQEARDMGKLRHFAATRIQALWRGRAERQQQAEFLHFMQHHRHRLASRIQAAWRRSQARAAAERRHREVLEQREATARHRQRCVAATRIASVVRMYRVRKMMATEGLRLRPTDYMLYTNARRIQCAWRCFAAKQYVHQVRLATAYNDNEKVSQEALHAYATHIQALVRGRILNPIRVAVWQHAVRGLPRPGAPPAVAQGGSPAGGGAEEQENDSSRGPSAAASGSETPQHTPAVEGPQETVNSQAGPGRFSRSPGASYAGREEGATAAASSGPSPRSAPHPPGGEAVRSATVQVMDPTTSSAVRVTVDLHSEGKSPRTLESDRSLPDKPVTTPTSSCLSSGRRKDPLRHIRFRLPGDDSLRTADTTPSPVR